MKWFKSDKGFGFVELANGTGDAFLHIGAVQAAGYESLPPGAKLKVNVSSSLKGQQVSRIIEADLAGASERAPPPRTFDGPRPPRRQAPDPSTAVTVAGKVKWFDESKGFGFVQSNDGGKDVFVHISILCSLGREPTRRGPAGHDAGRRYAKGPRGAVDIDAVIGASVRKFSAATPCPASRRFSLRCFARSQGPR